MSELQFKQENLKIRITRGQHREETQVLVQFPYCLGLYHRYKQLDGNYIHTNMSWWREGERMAGQPHEDLRVSSSTKYIKKARIIPISKKRKELSPITAIKAKRWSEVKNALARSRNIIGLKLPGYFLGVKYIGKRKGYKQVVVKLNKK